MNADNKNLIVTILAVIGGIVVLSWLLGPLLGLLRLVIIIGLIIVGAGVIMNLVGKGR